MIYRKTVRSVPLVLEKGGRGRLSRPAGLLLCSLLLAACGRNEPPQTEQAAVDPLTQVEIPNIKGQYGDAPIELPAEVAYPSSDPRSLEGYWEGWAMPVSEDGKPPPYLPEVKAEQARRQTAEDKGAPTVPKGTLCRSVGTVTVGGNQFPTQIIQRPEKIVVISEEGRGVSFIYMNAEHPKDLKPSLKGHNVGHWEGNTLVIDTVGLRATWGPLGDRSEAAHIVTRITRANTGDKRNGDRLVIKRTINDPKIYEHPYTTLSLARWRPDLEMLEHNCEESPADLAAEGLVVE